MSAKLLKGDIFVSSRSLFCLIVFVLTLSSCATKDYQSFVHTQNWPSQPSAGPRQLVVFMDGTGNDVTSRTNVRRLFEMTVSLHRPDFIAYYDPGVGTGRRLTHRILGGAFGFGLQGNLREALTFLTENYRAGDEISIFGFSRGAYSAAVLASLVSGAGLPLLDPKVGESVEHRHKRAVEVAKTYYRAVHSATLQAKNHAKRLSKQNKIGPPEERARLWRKDYWEKLQKAGKWSATENRVRPDIAVLGLWEPVDSTIDGLFLAPKVGKIGWSVSDRSEFGRHRGHSSHPYVLGPKIKTFLMALSLDEERQPFTVELPDFALGQPEAYEFVWFVGDHSDVGGGHKGDKDLAGISMNWMLAHVGDRLFGPGGSRIRVYEDYAGARHDLSVSKRWQKAAYRVRGEVLGSLAQLICPIPERKIPFFFPDAKYLIPVRYKGWRMKIHGSVLKRMASKQDRFYTPDEEAHIIDLAVEPLAKPYACERNPKGKYSPRAFRTLPAVRASDDSWAAKMWTAEEISSTYEIVDTP